LAPHENLHTIRCEKRERRLSADRSESSIQWAHRRSPGVQARIDRPSDPGHVPHMELDWTQKPTPTQKLP
jgi:hypothetical protein